MVSYEEAKKMQANRETDLPWAKSYIDSRIQHHIDIQSCEQEDQCSTP